MAASEETCDGNPNFAIICSFITKFGDDCGVNISVPDLQEMLEDTKKVHEQLLEILLHLMRRGRKRVNKERWEKCIIKFCHEYSSVDAWEIERFGFLKSKLSVKLELLKRLLELQFDANAKFKAEVNKHDACSLRILPLGRDIDGQSYWYQLDKEYNMRLYRETIDEDGGWQLVCSTTDDIKTLLASLEKKHPNSTKEASDDFLKDFKDPKSPSSNLPVPKKEPDSDDLTSCSLSETKPCTIIIKTEKRDSLSHPETPNCVKKENCATVSETSKKIESRDSESSTKGSVKLKLKLDPSSYTKVEQQKSKKDVMKDSSETNKSAISSSDVESMEVDTAETTEADTASLVKDISSADTDDPKKDEKVLSEEKVKSEEHHDQNTLTADSASVVNTDNSDSVNHHKSSKIKLYEKWSNEKKKLDVNQTTSAEESSSLCAAMPQPEKEHCDSATSNQKDNPAVLKFPKEQSHYSEHADKPEMSVESSPASMESAVDLSKSPRVNVIVQNSCSKPAVSNGVSPPPKLLHEEKAGSGGKSDSKSAEMAKKDTLPVEKPEDLTYRSHEIESGKFQKKSKMYLDCYNSPVMASKKTGFSHLQALQNMCESNSMGGIPSVIQSTHRCHAEPSGRTVISENKNLANSSSVIENVGRKYNLNDVQHPSDQVLSSDTKKSDVLLKSNVPRKEDRAKHNKYDELQIKAQGQVSVTDIPETSLMDLSCPADKKSCGGSRKSDSDMCVDETDASTAGETRSTAAKNAMSVTTKEADQSVVDNENIRGIANVSEELPEVTDMECEPVEEEATNLCISSQIEVNSNAARKDVKNKISGADNLLEKQKQAVSSNSSMRPHSIGGCKRDASSKCAYSENLPEQSCQDLSVPHEDVSGKESTKNDGKKSLSCSMQESSSRSKINLLEVSNSEESKIENITDKREILKSTECVSKELDGKSVKEPKDTDSLLSTKSNMKLLEKDVTDNMSSVKSILKDTTKSDASRDKVETINKEQRTAAAELKSTDVSATNKEKSLNKNEANKNVLPESLALKESSGAKLETITCEKNKKLECQTESGLRAKSNELTEKCQEITNERIGCPPHFPVLSVSLLKTDKESTPKDGEQSKLKTDDQSGIEKKDLAKFERDCQCVIEKEKQSKSEQHSQTKVEKQDQSQIERSKESKIEEKEEVKIKNDEESKSGKDKESKIEKGKESKIEKIKVSKTELEKESKVEKGEDFRNEKDIESKDKNDKDSEVEKDVESKTEKDVESKTEKDVESKTEKDVECKTEKDVESKTEKDEECKRKKDEESKKMKDEESKRKKDEESKRKKDEESKRKKEEESKRKNEESKREKDEESKREKDEESKREKDAESKRKKDEESNIEKYEESKNKKDEESNIEKDKESKMEKNKESKVKKGKDSAIEKDKESEVENFKETITEKNKEFKIEKNEVSKTEKDKESNINKGKESIIKNYKDSEIEKCEEAKTEKDKEYKVEKDKESVIEKYKDSKIEKHNDTKILKESKMVEYKETEKDKDLKFENVKESAIEKANEFVIAKNKESETEKEKESKMEECKESVMEKDKESKTGKNKEPKTEKIQKEEESKIEKDKESKIEKDKESKIEKDKESKIEKDKESKIEKDKESKIEKDKESKIEKDKESKIEKDKESKIEKDGESRIENEKQSKSDKNKESKTEKYIVSATEKAKESKTVKDKKSKIEKDKESKIAKSKESIIDKDKKSGTEKDKESETAIDAESKIEKKKESNIDKDNKSKIGKTKESVIDKDKNSRTEKNKESETEKDNESKTEKDKESKTENDKESEIEKKKKSKIDEGNESKIGKSEEFIIDKDKESETEKDKESEIEKNEESKIANDAESETEKDKGSEIEKGKKSEKEEGRQSMSKGDKESKISEEATQESNKIVVADEKTHTDKSKDAEKETKLLDEANAEGSLSDKPVGGSSEVAKGSSIESKSCNSKSDLKDKSDTQKINHEKPLDISEKKSELEKTGLAKRNVSENLKSKESGKDAETSPEKKEAAENFTKDSLKISDAIKFDYCEEPDFNTDHHKTEKGDVKCKSDLKSKTPRSKAPKKTPVAKRNAKGSKISKQDDLDEEMDCPLAVLSSKKDLDDEMDCPLAALSSKRSSRGVSVASNSKKKSLASAKGKITSMLGEDEIKAKNMLLAEQFKVYNLRLSMCLESKFKHPSCDRYIKLTKPSLSEYPPVVTLEEDSCSSVETTPIKKGRGRGRYSKQLPASKVTPKKSLIAPNSSKRPVKSRKKEENKDFSIPEGFLEILGNAEKASSEKASVGKRRRGVDFKEAPGSHQSSESESTPRKRSRRIQDLHQKKMSELAVEMEKEQRILEQMAKRSNSAKQNKAPPKTPVKQNGKGPNVKIDAKVPVSATKTRKSKSIEIISEEDTCMESGRRTTRKMNSRSKNLTKMTLLYEDESKDSQFSTSRETEKSKKRRRGRSHKKGFKPWDVSSESSSSSLEELTEEEEEEEHEEPLIFDVNEDEFACEEVDPNAEPVVIRRARTAKKTEVADAAETCINDDTPCQKCGKYDKPEWILLCDKCDSGYHTHCLIPPLMIVPDGDWFCQPCEHMALCQCLHEELSKLEVILKQKEREELRKQRLAYVGISLDNVLKPEKKEKSDESSKEEEEEEEEESEKEQENRKPLKPSQSTEDERHQKLYGKRSVRARRNVNYQFKEYDELIFSALQEDMVEVPEEFKEENSEADSDKPFTAKISKRKKRKSFRDFGSSDEDDSGEEYQGGSSDSEATAPPSSHSDRESGSGEWKVVKSRKKQTQRKPRSRRRRRGDDSSEEDWEDEVVDETYRPTTRRAAQKAVSYREISSEEEDEWGAPKRQVTQKRRKASSSDSETSFKKKPSKKKRVRRWEGSDSSEESEEKSMSSSGESEEEEGGEESKGEESESEWKIKHSSKEKPKPKPSAAKKVLSSDEEDEEEESSTQDSAPKKTKKFVSEEESDEDDDEDEDEEESESEENSDEEDDDDEEEEEEEEDQRGEKKTAVPEKKTAVPEKKTAVPEKKAAPTANKTSSAVNSEKKPDVEKKEVIPDKRIVSVDKETNLPITDDKEFHSKVLVQKELCSVSIPLEPMKQPVSFTASSEAPLKPVRKETTKMVPCVIPYDKSPKSGHTSNPEEESDKEAPKEAKMPPVHPIPPPLNRPPMQYPPRQGAPFPPHSSRIQFGGVLPRHPVPPLTSAVRPPPSSNLPSRFVAPANFAGRPPVPPSGVVVRHHVPPARLPARPPSSMPLPPSSAPPKSAQTVQNRADNKPYKSSIMEPFSNMDDENDSDDEVPLERIPTANAPTPLPNRPAPYEKETEYRPAAKELSTYSYAPPDEKPFPASYSSLSSFQDFSARPSPLKPSLVETYPNNSSSPSKLTPLDSYPESNSPKGFISLDSYSESRKKKHFYGSASHETPPPPPTHRSGAAAAPPPPENYQGGEIRFPPEPYPCPQSPNTYSHRSPPPNQRDPGTPPRLYSQFPDAYAPPRSPEYYQNHQYYASEERTIPRPSYQPNYAPQDPPFPANPYVATPVPQPNGGFMIDTLLRARNHEEGEDELTGVTDIVSYITQE